jgi:hypothetical protein
MLKTKTKKKLTREDIGRWCSISGLQILKAPFEFGLNTCWFIQDVFKEKSHTFAAVRLAHSDIVFKVNIKKIKFQKPLHHEEQDGF